ncbi:hypothetical protein ALO95_200201 [Pseudomonas syringae pv. antirrhini]|uniref:Polyamine ABC transporter substrate-binding protein n=1 Tax=Pseudomonas syringae pv. antirrhini TaxID=251702 RepID=A0A0N8QQB7_9PSED|nr:MULTISPECIES: extracellular solute-binding protein [Pseudomonas]KPW52742.1 Polyamine ABC transporter substrate-binding protein [Pseudomonas syringae pv. antirrhini]RMP32102.1 Polyamine ABC transporter substrate-binding protein [Pseudomonas syringae pv. antirrhini]RMP42475.1 hypothetical protein ALQ23_200369 [Pseudomonas syringae pv. antirrhini]RMW23454.1 hypothetical protein ALO95_200201 [Pseudomonas syringae pv. antirrhini]WIN08828.1 extracellular solute-binding protein [Pseudomonas syring
MQSIEEDSIAILKDKLVKKEITKRDFLKACLVVSGGVAMSSLGLPSAYGNEQMTVANQGGDAVKVFGDAWTTPFERGTGIKVNIDGSGTLVGTVKKMVDDRNVHWDVLDGDGFFSPMLGADYLEPIDYNIVSPNGFFDWNKQTYGAGNYVYSVVLAYDKSKLSTAPKNWVDFFDRKNFPGKRALFKWFLCMPEVCMLGAGRKPEEIYPIDMNLVTEMVQSLGDDLVLWDSGASSQQLFLDGEVVMGAVWNTRATSVARDTNDRIAWTWEDQIVTPATWNIPKGAKNVAAAQRFIASTQDIRSQIKVLELMGYGPANPAAINQLNEAQARINPTSHLDKGIIRNDLWYAQHMNSELGTWLDAISG